ncbi:MAG TPA: hypothetical protein ENH10_01795 [Bacteroidetes bacterium]|nr:hypothetical protein BMS3Bbin04_00302 [bacterium BMS3Bbin04]HDO64750.1 hypothetical protein [Bacteroidota bacterium]HEX03875.1 hypothetical protein [Bacteroidota bacterium]
MLVSYRIGLIMSLILLLTSALQAQVSEDVNGHGTINWSDQVVRAVGISVQGGVGGRAGQIRAAELDALRQILETIKGIRINSETTVEEFMLDSDRIRTQIEGVAKNFRRVGDPVYQSDGSIELTVEMDITGQGMLLERVIYGDGETAAPLYDTAPPGSSVYTGLIVDARGLGVRPALAPVIKDEAGQVIYGERYVERDWLIKHGMAEYAKDLATARNNDRVGSNPLVIKAIRAEGSNRTDVTVSSQNAALLHAVERHLTFLQQARVIFLVD